MVIRRTIPIVIVEVLALAAIVAVGVEIDPIRLLDLVDSPRPADSVELIRLLAFAGVAAALLMLAISSLFRLVALLSRSGQRIWRRLAGTATATALTALLTAAHSGPAAASIHPGLDGHEMPSDQTEDRRRLVPHPGLNRISTSVAPEPLRGPPSHAEHVVRKGDNLWTIAESHLRAHSEAQVRVAVYWSLVIEANRDRLRSGNPNLIFPGERLVLPPLPSESL